MERKLVAILAADLVAFSAMMERDEPFAYELVSRLRRTVIEPAVAEAGGRLFKTTGDGFLAEFGSALAATRCALSIQRALSSTATRLADARLRIGINLGDVIVETDGDLYGAGVNLAVRLEQAAAPGGILMSEAVYEQVRGRLDEAFISYGFRTFKNIARPVSIFGSKPPAAGLDGPDIPPSPPVGPSIAVLPFANLSGRDDLDYLSDGFTSEITASLARLRWLFVIAPDSSRSFKGRNIEKTRIGHELGVRYLLEGSFRKSGDRLRVLAQLIDAQTGAHIWAERFDGQAAEVFELEDEVTAKVITLLEPRLRHVEIARVTRKRPESLTAYDFFLRALPQYYSESRDGLAVSLDLLQQAMAADPAYAPAIALASQCYTYADGQGWLADLGWRIDDGVAMARQAIARDRDDPTVLWMAAHTLAALAGDYDSALDHLTRSLELNRNSAWAHDRTGWVLCYSGDPKMAIEHFETAIRLSPVDQATFRFHTGLALAHVMLGQNEEALAWSRRVMGEQPGWWTSGYRTLAASLAHLGRADEARLQARRMLELDPSFDLARTRRMYRTSVGRERFIEGMRLAGIPERSRVRDDAELAPENSLARGGN
jgi:adenylate cyclase